MARSLRKADKLTKSDLADAPAGKWTDKLTDTISALVDASDQLRAPGLEARVGSVVQTLGIATNADWQNVVLDPDWKSLLSPQIPYPSCRKYDDGTAELRGAWQYLHVTGSSVAGQLPQSWMYPDAQYCGCIATAPGNTLYRLDVYADGFIRLDNGFGPTVATNLVSVGSIRWQCADPTPPPHLSSPIVVNHGFAALGAMHVQSCVLSDAQSIQLPIPSLAWLDLGNGSVKITNVAGLPGGKKYILKLVFIQG